MSEVTTESVQEQIATANTGLIVMVVLLTIAIIIIVYFFNWYLRKVEAQFDEFATRFDEDHEMIKSLWKTIHPYKEVQQHVDSLRAAVRASHLSASHAGRMVLFANPNEQNDVYKQELVHLAEAKRNAQSLVNRIDLQAEEYGLRMDAIANRQDPDAAVASARKSSILISWIFIEIVYFNIF